jgi:hypothetical protein
VRDQNYANFSAQKALSCYIHENIYFINFFVWQICVVVQTNKKIIFQHDKFKHIVIICYQSIVWSTFSFTRSFLSFATGHTHSSQIILHVIRNSTWAVKYIFGKEFHSIWRCCKWKHAPINRNDFDLSDSLITNKS